MKWLIWLWWYCFVANLVTAYVSHSQIDYLLACVFGLMIGLRWIARTTKQKAR